MFISKPPSSSGEFAQQTHEMNCEAIHSAVNNAVLLTLANHRGRDNPIPGRELLARLAPYKISGRQMREHIRDLRRAGCLIGSAPGVDGGYYLITTPEEFQDFVQAEYLAKIIDMQYTLEIMTHSARRSFETSSLQLRLF